MQKTIFLRYNRIMAASAKSGYSRGGASATTGDRAPKNALSKSSNLRQAKTAKKDEFYTQLTDIEKEMKHYKNHFKDKVVYCNCDDPRVSNFFRYFAHGFERLGLKKLIATCYKNKNPDLFSENKSAEAVGIEYKIDKSNKNSVPHNEYMEKIFSKTYPGNMDELGMLRLEEIGIKPLEGDGDFRSAECVDLLKQADIVVTNPPFSLFREYVDQLIKFKKQFVIIGNQNAITYKEIFKLIKDKKLWLGASIHSGDREFGIPDDYPLTAAGCRVDETGGKFIRVKGVRWFTNLDHKQRHEDLVIHKSHEDYEGDYPQYDNYDAINVDKTKDIPANYKGAMGVPITFLDKYNPEQFDILALGIVGSIEFSCNKKMEILKGGRPTGKYTYNAKGTLYKIYNPETDKEPAFKDCLTGQLYSSIYARVIIKNRRV